ncbi:NPC intracellular cholesterol transporter 2 [Taenia crassiceps]|uniref:NPC intracellular cholesterol transporter 2 n=1 Tax=Taenia crassiceps TaxID=6207 RepID=A0ABR4QFB8_9CEST
MHALAGLLCTALFVTTYCHAAIPGMEDCSTPSSQGKFIDGEITPCGANPCVLVKGQNTSITLKFIATNLVKGGKIVVHGIIAGIAVPFTLPDNDLCHFVQPGCSIQPNLAEQMDYSLYVKESYPSIQLTIKWQLVNDVGVDLVCIKFPAKLSSTPPTETSTPRPPTRTLFGHLRHILGKWLSFGSRV